MNRYAIITPAHNEGHHLERTIHSVLAQGHKPVRWVIVSDGSTDNTAEIAKDNAARSSFIQVVVIKRDGNHTFGNKARAFNAAIPLLRGLDFEYIGNLDADVSFETNYFENLIHLFEQDPHLGIAGGIIYTTVGGRFVTHDETLDSVGGAVQLFRRRCFEDIGGEFLPLPYGGIDAAAEIIAKMKGWRVRKSLENRVFEHRQTGTAASTPLAAGFRLGRRFHSLGYGILFHTARSLYRLGDPPFILGSCASCLGFLEAVVKQRPIMLPNGVVKHLRNEQRKRLCRMLAFWSSRRSADAGDLAELDEGS